MTGKPYSPAFAFAEGTLPEPLIFDLSAPGRTALCMPACDVPACDASVALPGCALRAAPAGLPEISQVDAVRHYTHLSQRNYGVDGGFYPLGSCTMKFNPKVNEEAAALPGFASAHPLAPDSAVQGCLQVMSELSAMLCEITGMAGFSLQPAAGAHGELAGMMIMRAYHEHRGDSARRSVLIPDAAHGTNPASAAVAGLKVVQIPTNEQGGVDIGALRAAMGPDVAGLMLTNPNTLGLFEPNIREVADIVHAGGGLLYYDGANLNAVMGRARPGDMGFDIVHLNLHKTFSTPHGGGGPGSGPVGVCASLVPFLPGPLSAPTGDGYALAQPDARSIGRVRAFHGNFLVALRAYVYIRTLGASGLRDASENAVLNANYVLHRLKGKYLVPFERLCMHEAVFSGLRDKSTHMTTLDVAKRLLDYGFHPPTVYFPLIVKEALMVEPTETESRETLDAFCDALLQIADEAVASPELLTSAPHAAPVTRLDETRAARTPRLKA